MSDIGHAIVCIYVRVEIRRNVYLRYDVHNYVVQRCDELSECSRTRIYNTFARQKGISPLS